MKMNRPSFARAAALSVALLVAGCAARPEPSRVLQFEFHSSFLLNLHHVLYDAARHPGKLDKLPWVQPPSADEMAAMREAVAFYAANVAQRDLLFDDGLGAVKHALATADDAREDPRGLALPPGLADALARAAPVYARCLWDAQDAANRAWMARVSVLEARYGAAIQPRLERAFGRAFPPRIRDDVVVATGTFQGAYTDEPPPQTVIPSGRADYDGPAALEMIWHEAAHAGPDDGLEQAIADAAKAAHRKEPDGLWHAAHFYAVGVVVQDVLKADGVDYVQYATKGGLYARAWPQYLPLLQSDWDAWVHGAGTQGDALRAMVAKLPAA